jgi:hypothetical protein
VVYSGSSGRGIGISSVAVAVVAVQGAEGAEEVWGGPGRRAAVDEEAWTLLWGVSEHGRLRHYTAAFLHLQPSPN